MKSRGEALKHCWGVQPVLICDRHYDGVRQWWDAEDALHSTNEVQILLS